MLTFTSKELPRGAFGHIPNQRTAPHEATISLAPVASSRSNEFVNYAINVGAHEAGHASGALIMYNNDSAKAGSILHPYPARPGTIMEVVAVPEILSGELREFSEEDSRLLVQALNPVEENQP